MLYRDISIGSGGLVMATNKLVTEYALSERARAQMPIIDLSTATISRDWANSHRPFDGCNGSSVARSGVVVPLNQSSFTRRPDSTGSACGHAICACACVCTLLYTWNLFPSHHMHDDALQYLVYLYARSKPQFAPYFARSVYVFVCVPDAVAPRSPADRDQDTLLH